jgi:hypothetical protein
MALTIKFPAPLRSWFLWSPSEPTLLTDTMAHRRPSRIFFPFIHVFILFLSLEGPLFSKWHSIVGPAANETGANGAGTIFNELVMLLARHKLLARFRIEARLSVILVAPPDGIAQTVLHLHEYRGFV